jgi:thiamine-monophosphate kinase
MSRRTPLGPGAEFDRLRAIFTRLGRDGKALGDDCAILNVGKTRLAASVDASLEGVHFRTDWLSFEEIGWRAAAGALSDLAAEGAKPVGVLVALGIPDGKGAGGPDVAAEIMGGVGAAARSVGAKVVGGDLTRSERYVVDVCVLGTCERPVRRSGARPGDGVWVTGTLGGPGLALQRFRSGTPPSGELRARFARPVPRIAAGRWLARRGARAMIDISDGLAQDASHIAAASGLTIDIELDRLPCWAGVTPGAAAASGEEFELLVALPAAFGARAAAAFTRATRLPITQIGRCRRGTPEVRVTRGGAPVPTPAGFDHFASP